MKLNKIIKVLKTNGYKITKPREAILNVLSDSKHIFLSIDSIFSKSKEINDNINMTTIYRNLEMLESLNLIYKILSDDGTTLYQLKCNKHHHHHMICNGCGKTQIIDFCPMSDLKKISQDNNFKLTKHKIELFGYCSDCSND